MVEGILIDAWPFFVFLILALLLFGAMSALQHSKRYSKTETLALNYVSDKLLRLREIGETSDDVTNEPSARGDEPGAVDIRKRAQSGPSRLIPIKDLLEGLSKETIIADRLALIKHMRESQVKVSMSVLQQMTLAKEASAKGIALPSLATNLSMMLGLLGTIVGLMQMVRQIDLGLPQDVSQVTIDSWIASIGQIRSVLGGMKIAFTATIAGISSAIILTWLNHRLSRYQALFLDKLDRFTTKELLPATVPSSEDESLLEKISLQLERSFSRLDEVAEKNEETIVELNSIEKGFIEIIDTVRQTTRTETSERIHELIWRITGIVDHMSALNKSVSIATDAVPQVIKETEKAHHAALTRIDRLIAVYEEQRSLVHWPLQIKIIFGFMAALNFFFIASSILR